MTAIAFRDGLMAADTGVTGGYLIRGHTKKIVRRADGAIAAASGHGGACQAFRDWFLQGGRGRFDPESKRDDDFGAIIAYPDGLVVGVDAYGRPTSLDAPFHVQGACEDVLFGAMAAGATAEEAVWIAIRNSDGAHGVVQVERVGVPLVA